MDDDIKSISSQFEAVKIAMTQDKNGHVLKLSIHPSDTPEDIMRDPVGTRYMAVIVRLSDEGEPVASQSTQEGISAVKLAATLCGDEKFQEWLCMKGHAHEMNEEAAARAMRNILNVTSRKELKTNANARQRLLDIRAEFVNDIRANHRGFQ